MKVLALAVLGLFFSGLTAYPEDRPNFVVILGEAQGWASTSVLMDDAIPASKSELARTPNLERLAAEGMRFANFYAASPRCTPSRAALLTGRSPAALHMTFVGEGHGGRESGYSETESKLLPAKFTSELPLSETTIAQLLKPGGYVTAHFGKWHLGKVNPAQHGFDESDGPTNNGGPENVDNPNPKEALGMTRRAIDFIERETKAGKPFYVQISHYPSRGGLDSTPGKFAEIQARVPNVRNPRRIGAAAETEDMDGTIGTVLAKIDELGIAGSTFIFYTSDHGAQGRGANTPLSNGKGSVWEGGIRVPLIVRGPGVSPGSCTRVRASMVDLLPTIAALVGVKKLPEGVEGGSLVSVLDGSPKPLVKRSREELVIHVPHYDKGETPASALLSGDLKLVHNYETGTMEVFDLRQDIEEQNNLALKMSQKAKELDQKLSEYLKGVKAEMAKPNPQFGVKE